MKYLIQLIAIVVMALSISCDSLLDVEADGVIGGEIYNSQENIQKALNGAYYSFGGIYDGTDGGELFGGDFILIPTLIVAQNVSEVSWDGTNGPLYSDFLDNKILPTNLRIESNWRRSYEVINILNHILKNINNVTTEKDRIEGEALAMRGMLYFEMVRLWGAEYESTTISSPSIPLLTEPISTVKDIVTPTLATVGKVYEQVQEDLEAASILLEPLGKNGANLSHYACEAILMRVAMHKGEYNQAETHASKIIGTNGVFDLTDTPFEAFNNFENSVEDIFGIQQTVANNTGDITTSTGLTYYYSSVVGKGVGALRIQGASFNTTSLINRPKFAPEDLRGMIISDTDSMSLVGNIDELFYRNINNTSTFSSGKYLSADRVIPVIRLAEIHLARAEAIARQDNAVTQEAIDDLNETRTRAGVVALQVDDFTNGGFDALIDSIKIEKKREFLYEGLIFHDLKRWNDEIGIPGTPATDPKFILPIPQSETDTWK